MHILEAKWIQQIYVHITDSYIIIDTPCSHIYVTQYLLLLNTACVGIDASGGCEVLEVWLLSASFPIRMNSRESVITCWYN